VRHRIPIEELRPEMPQVDAMAEAVNRCVHCGFCLATCPTYHVLGEEMDSPRGRIVLMKEVLEGGLTLDDALPHVDPCLGCVACETSCPSGVAYGELVTPFRWWAEEERARGLVRGRLRRLRRRTLLRVLAAPRLARAALRLGGWVRPLRRLLPGRLSTALDLLPPVVKASSVPARAEAVGERRARVALLQGCVQEPMRPEIHRATLAVLARNGVEVVVPEGQPCCGALALHAGEAELARGLARRILDAFPLDEVDAVLTHAAGCGSGLADYPALFRGRPEEERARRLASRVRDVSSFLAELGLVGSLRLERPQRVACHDPCHLAHAQRERAAPRALLRRIGGLELVEPPSWELCCGSAGIYNLEEPGIAARLGRERAEQLAATKADRVVTGNIGCLVQLRHALTEIGHPLPVLHTMELLAEAYDVGSEGSP
jgi:glycolate oxidase iron-sulfur subunit